MQYIALFVVLSVLPLAQDRPMRTSVLRCDGGRSTVKLDIYAQGSLITITSASGDKYFVPKFGNSYTFGFQPSYSSMPRGIAMSSWMERVAQDSPNAYRYYERQPNDCVEEKR